MLGFVKYLQESKEELCKIICKTKKYNELEKMKDTSVIRLEKFKNIVLMKQLTESKLYKGNKGVYYAIDEKT